MTPHYILLYSLVAGKKEPAQHCGNSSISGKWMRRTMSEIHTSSADQPEPGLYEIRIKGHLDDRWSDWFDGLTITLEESGDTLLTGPVVDQAALYGLLKKIRDLGMPLVSVNRVQSEETHPYFSDKEKNE
jgi:hypothetical protein